MYFVLELGSVALHLSLRCFSLLQSRQFRRRFRFGTTLSRTPAEEFAYACTNPSSADATAVSLQWPWTRTNIWWVSSLSFANVCDPSSKPSIIEWHQLATLNLMPFDGNRSVFQCEMLRSNENGREIFVVTNCIMSSFETTSNRCCQFHICRLGYVQIVTHNTVIAFPSVKNEETRALRRKQMKNDA